MKSLFTVCFEDNTIIATKTTLKKASVPNSPEYKALMKLMKQNPTFAVVVKEIKKAEGKKTYAGLKNDFIKDYISIKENAEELEQQYNKAYEMGKFVMARKWFLNTFKNFDMEEAKREIAKARLAAIAA